jgi:hypothetical protein
LTINKKKVRLAPSRSLIDNGNRAQLTIIDFHLVQLQNGKTSRRSEENGGRRERGCEEGKKKFKLSFATQNEFSPPFRRAMGEVKTKEQ